MARVPKVLTLTQPIWPDKTIYASVFADQPPTPDHATPQTADPDWSSFVTDYVSQSDTIAQTLASQLKIKPGVATVPLIIEAQTGDVTDDLFQVNDQGSVLQANINAVGRAQFRNNFAIGNIAPTVSNVLTLSPIIGSSPGGSLTMFLLNRAYQLNLSNAVLRDLLTQGTVTSAGGGLTGLQFIGLSYQPDIQGNVADTFSLVIGIQSNVRIRTGPVTEVDLFKALGTTFSGAVTTLRYYYAATFVPTTAITTAVGLDIEAMPTATTKLGIRQQGSGDVNKLSGKTRIGDQTSPTEFLEVAGNVLATLNLKQNTSPGSPSSVGLANSAGSSVLVPALDHVHQALPGTLVLINADETQSSATVPNADTAVKTYTLAANTYTSIIAEAEGYVQESLTTTNQNVNIKIKFAGAQNGQTMIFNPQALTTGAKTPFPVKASGAFTAGGTVTVTIGAAAADANTTVFLNSLRVYGVV